VSLIMSHISYIGIMKLVIKSIFCGRRIVEDMCYRKWFTPHPPPYCSSESYSMSLLLASYSMSPLLASYCVTRRTLNARVQKFYK
jgi:hypothetical protein